MNILGNGDMDDSWLEGNANGREEALKEVLEKVESIGHYELKEYLEKTRGTPSEDTYEGFEIALALMHRAITKQLKAEDG